jgi:hypothetical protein
MDIDIFPCCFRLGGVERRILGAWPKVALLGLIAWKQSHVNVCVNIEAGAF